MKKILIIILIFSTIKLFGGKTHPELLTLRNWIFVLKLNKQNILDNKIIIPLPSPMKVQDAFIYIRGLIQYTNNARNCKIINTKLFNSICDQLDLKDMKIN